MDSIKSVLVVSAHAADFVWRAGGAIALYAQRGYRVRILCLSHGERGESERLWRQPGMTGPCAILKGLSGVSAIGREPFPQEPAERPGAR